MAVKASAQITIQFIVDVKATYRYYLLQSSTLTAPSKPTTFSSSSPPSGWDDTEPSYTSESTNSLYFVDCTVFCDDTFKYSEVSLSSSYEAAKEAYNKAQNAQSTASNAQDTANDAQSALVDVTARIAVNESDITSIAGHIRNLVVDSNGNTLMEQSGDGWTFNIGAFDDRLNTASKDIQTLISDAGSMESLVGSLESTLKDHGSTLEYINIGTYDGEPCIELGESDSNFKLRITNTSIQFMEGSDTPAYISNQALNIKKAIIENELQIGNFVWTERDNHNVGLMWKEGTS